MRARLNSPALRAKLAAFTLLELLVVFGLIAALSLVLLGGLGGGKSAALQSAQGLLANYVMTARTRAVATGNSTRLLICSSLTDAGYRRRLVLVEERDGTWLTVDAQLLPAGVYVLPYRTRVPAGMYENPGEWRNAGGQEVLGSSALNHAPVSHVFEGAAAQSWEYVGFKPAGTAETGAGSLVLAGGRLRPPAGQATGASPVVMIDPQNVRGLQLSTYGVPRLINDRTGF